MSVLRQLYRWSVEELRLASGEEGVTRLQHQLKLCGAYSGVPVCCIPKSTPTSIKLLNQIFLQLLCDCDIKIVHEILIWETLEFFRWILKTVVIFPIPP